MCSILFYHLFYKIFVLSWFFHWFMFFMFRFFMFFFFDIFHVFSNSPPLATLCFLLCFTFPGPCRDTSLCGLKKLKIHKRNENLETSFLPFVFLMLVLPCFVFPLLLFFVCFLFGVVCVFPKNIFCVSLVLCVSIGWLPGVQQTVCVWGLSVLGEQMGKEKKTEK